MWKHFVQHTLGNGFVVPVTDQTTLAVPMIERFTWAEHEKLDDTGFGTDLQVLRKARGADAVVTIWTSCRSGDQCDARIHS